MYKDFPEGFTKYQGQPYKDYSWLREHCEKTLSKPISQNAKMEHIAVLNLIEENKKMSIEIDKIARAVSDYKTQLIDVDELISQIDGAWSESNHIPFSF